MLALIVQLLSGAVGGNLIAELAPGATNMGTLINTIGGVVGGGLGGAILSKLGVGGGYGNFDIKNIGALVSNVAGSFVGGGVVLAIVKAVMGMIGG